MKEKNTENLQSPASIRDRYKKERLERLQSEGISVRGFEGSDISNDIVKGFLIDTFTSEVLRETNITDIIKDDNYVLFEPIEHKTECSTCRTIITSQLITASSLSIYKEHARQLEGIPDDQEPNHTYNRISESIIGSDFNKIYIHNLGCANLKKYPYLNDEYFDGPNHKQAAFLLGTVAYEVSFFLPIPEHYHEIDRNYLAESVRAYVINSDHLKSNDLQTFDLVVDIMPYITPGLYRY